MQSIKTRRWYGNGLIQPGVVGVRAIINDIVSVLWKRDNYILSSCAGYKPQSCVDQEIQT